MMGVCHSLGERDHHIVLLNVRNRYNSSKLWLILHTIVGRKIGYVLFAVTKYLARSNLGRLTDSQCEGIQPLWREAWQEATPRSQRVTETPHLQGPEDRTKA